MLKSAVTQGKIEITLLLSCTF